MRTTVTLDDDVHAKLEREGRREGKTLEEVVNSYLRQGLSARGQDQPQRNFAVRPRAMGLREGLAIASGACLIGELEGPFHR